MTWKGSPNFNSGRGGKKITNIIIHWFGTGTLAGANANFQKSSSQVSAHYGVSNNTIYQWVDEKNTAWHCGNFDMNQRSIGIENDATTSHEATEETYKTCANLVRDICQRYNLPIDRNTIKKHSEIKATQCPGTFNIDKVIQLAKGDEMVEPKYLDGYLKSYAGEVHWVIPNPEAFDKYVGRWDLVKEDNWPTNPCTAENARIADLDNKLKLKSGEYDRLSTERDDSIRGRDIKINTLTEELKTGMEINEKLKEQIKAIENSKKDTPQTIGEDICKASVPKLIKELLSRLFTWVGKEK
jgi:hypothetical protein